jgi:hypothetical protein
MSSCVSPAGEYGFDEPNTGPFCLMSTQPWAHALDVGRRTAAAASAAMAIRRRTEKRFVIRERRYAEQAMEAILRNH